MGAEVVVGGRVVVGATVIGACVVVVDVGLTTPLKETTLSTSVTPFAAIVTLVFT